MVEIIEYSLVLLTSLLFAGYGVYLFTDYARYANRSNSIATFSSIVSAAWSSIESNSARRVVVFLNNVTLACNDGSFTLASSSYQMVSTIPAACNFKFGGIIGLRTLIIRDASGSLTLQVEN